MGGVERRQRRSLTFWWLPNGELVKRATDNGRYMFMQC